MNLTELENWCMALTDVGKILFSCVVVLLGETEVKTNQILMGLSHTKGS